MKQKLFEGKCLWDFYIEGEVIILDDELSVLVEKCVNKIVFVHSPSPDIFMYMQYASAVVAETGGLLCHAAVLAMEMGCPIVVGAVGASVCVRDGQIISLVGSSGNGVAYEK